MDSAVMMARIFGFFIGILGLWMLLYGDNVVKVMTSIKNSPANQYINSVVSMFLGLYIMCSFNDWTWNVMITLTWLGWVFFLRGFLGLFVPHLVVKCMMTNTSWMKTMGIIPFVWGLILIWAGYYM